MGLDTEAGMGYLGECREFFLQFRQTFHTTGSILPSSRALARALTRPLRRPGGGPRRILEVGPGTGAVTREIVRHLRPGDRLDIVEINSSFVEVIRRRFEEEPEFRGRRDQARLIHSPIQEVEGQAVYDVMVSGVPLANFVPSLVEEVFQSYRRLLRPEGTLSYFEYWMLRDLKRPFVSKDERDRLGALAVILDDKVRRFQVDQEIVVCNFPPAVARHFRFGGNPSRDC